MMIRFSWLLLPLILLSCSAEKILPGMMVAGEQQRAERLVDDIAKGKTPTPGLLEPKIAAQAIPLLGGMRARIPPPPVKLEVLHYRANLTEDRVSTATYQLSGGGRFALADVVTKTGNGKSEITGFHVREIDGPADSQLTFSLADKPVGHYLMLLAMIAAVGIMIAALIRIWSPGHFRRRWLWTVGALLGFGTFGLNWTTGQFMFQPISLNLLVVGFIKNPIFAPWILKVGIPVVAIIALFKHRGDGWQSEEENADPI